jgi:hypothetical protein
MSKQTTTNNTIERTIAVIPRVISYRVNKDGTVKAIYK